MTLEDSIHSQRLRVLRDAERLGNVSDACRRHGMSRTLFYRLRRRLENVFQTLTETLTCEINTLAYPRRPCSDFAWPW